MTEDSRSRKWQVTINNPVEKGYTHEKIKEIVKEFKNCVYWCMADETGGEMQTFHTHVYIHCSGAVRFSTMLKRFEGGHFEMCKGTSEQNRDYVFKQGKWKNTEKETTNDADSHYESGELPVERQGKRNDLDDLYDMIKAGMTDAQILEDSPSYMLHLDSIRKSREIVRAKKYEGKKRMLEVTYIYGKSGSGKTRSVFDRYGADAYFVTDYKHPFDEYEGQPVMVFDEFRSSLDMSAFLKYLDIYPLVLPARYSNKRACYTKVYIISNVPLYQQYEWYQKNEPETWKGLARRIHRIRIHTDKGVVEKTTEEYLDGFSPLTGERTPFDK